ncbi:MAG: hypothetical protein VX733_06160 [Candidatus Latescibacterota bacterium]|nr:hypothetical protein [Candidatus Latescibacterota bacterium]
MSPSPADRFTRLQKVAVFLIALGEERTREILSDVDLDTIEQLNAAMASLGAVSAEEKASVMLEFAHFFYADEALPGPSSPVPSSAQPESLGPPVIELSMESAAPPQKLDDLSTKKDDPLSDEEAAILKTLDQLRTRLNPGQIDWGRAGYDFGDGLEGSDPDRR